MLEVTTTGIHSHLGSQALGEVRHRLVDVLLWQLFLIVCKATFNSSVILDFGWSMVLFQHGAPDVMYSGFKSGELGAIHFLFQLGSPPNESVN